MQVAEVPEGLAAIAVGPELATALDALEPAQIPNDRILDVVAAQYGSCPMTRPGWRLS